jgi:hypothetical protein
LDLGDVDEASVKTFKTVALTALTIAVVWAVVFVVRDYLEVRRVAVQGGAAARYLYEATGVKGAKNESLPRTNIIDAALREYLERQAQRAAARAGVPAQVPAPAAAPAVGAPAK